MSLHKLDFNRLKKYQSFDINTLRDKAVISDKGALLIQNIPVQHLFRKQDVKNHTYYHFSQPYLVHAKISVKLTYEYSATGQPINGSLRAEMRIGDSDIPPEFNSIFVTGKNEYLFLPYISQLTHPNRRVQGLLFIEDVGVKKTVYNSKTFLANPISRVPMPGAMGLYLRVEETEVQAPKYARIGGKFVFTTCPGNMQGIGTYHDISPLLFEVVDP